MIRKKQYKFEVRQKYHLSKENNKACLYITFLTTYLKRQVKFLEQKTILVTNRIIIFLLQLLIQKKNITLTELKNHKINYAMQ